MRNRNKVKKKGIRKQRNTTKRERDREKKKLHVSTKILKLWIKTLKEIYEVWLNIIGSVWPIYSCFQYELQAWEKRDFLARKYGLNSKHKINTNCKHLVANYQNKTTMNNIWTSSFSYFRCFSGITLEAFTCRLSWANQCTALLCLEIWALTSILVALGGRQVADVLPHFEFQHVAHFFPRQ